MRTTLKATLLAAALLLPLSACKEEVAAVAPPPQAIAADAVGHYCGMNLSDHEGPKGQVILKGRDKPVWMSSVRDTFAFTMLPEEPKDYRAVYVTDLGRAADPANPDLNAWVDARKAWYVLGSAMKGGMGEAEPMPFAEETAARAFAARHGGTVKRFAEVKEDEILQPPQAIEEEHPADQHVAHKVHR
ncbi:MAG TPA: nitrous oxide reductase accessory protein NosL [Azospirillum sp.]|nr:nitrous oxide reductase accessory protein NosL [Azospirillum sp.]